ncbi:hypothetical protein OS190_16870 [Sulfitobacter sp. F26204]|uniref:hypothetical protein n=1 Tax=Sulfitobacter sp. F26204 TaxID=2996014 RepID=UPI00225E5997|nr:hypothetical protein [Sulfitobacter sp. F26204]MCX7561243.1 hypothetical protein [Sulfitobacter sp. F26204]
MKDLLRILIAPLMWLALFSAVYGLHGLLCNLGITSTALGFPLPRILLVVAYVIAIALQGMLLLLLYHPRIAARSPFVRHVSHVTGWTGLVATGWTLLPVVLMSNCT